MGFGNIDTGGQSWHMRAWDSTANVANAKRPLANVLSVGQSLSAQIAVAFRGGKKGFNLYQDKAATSFLVNFEVRFDQDNYYFNGSGLKTGAGVWDYSQTSVLELSAYRESSTTTKVRLKRGSEESTATFTSAAGIGCLEFYVDRTSDGNNLQGMCINNFKIY